MQRKGSSLVLLALFFISLVGVVEYMGWWTANPKSEGKYGVIPNTAQQSPTNTPEYFEYPLEFPERDAAFAQTVAQVRVAKVYSPRANNSSGTAPTRDPGIPPMRNGPSQDKELYTPVLLDVQQYYATDTPQVTGFLVAYFSGTVADFAGIPADISYPDYGLVEEEVLTVFLGVRHGTKPIDEFLASEAVGLGNTIDSGVGVSAIYRHSGTDIIRLGERSFTMPLDEFQDRIVTYIQNN